MTAPPPAPGPQPSPATPSVLPSPSWSAQDPSAPRAARSQGLGHLFIWGGLHVQRGGAQAAHAGTWERGRGGPSPPAPRHPLRGRGEPGGRPSARGCPPSPPAGGGAGWAPRGGPGGTLEPGDEVAGSGRCGHGPWGRAGRARRSAGGSGHQLPPLPAAPVPSPRALQGDPGALRFGGATTRPTPSQAGPSQFPTWPPPPALLHPKGELGVPSPEQGAVGNDEDGVCLQGMGGGLQGMRALQRMQGGRREWGRSAGNGPASPVLALGGSPGRPCPPGE